MCNLRLRSELARQASLQQIIDFTQLQQPLHSLVRLMVCRILKYSQSHEFKSAVFRPRSVVKFVDLRWQVTQYQQNECLN